MFDKRSASTVAVYCNAVRADQQAQQPQQDLMCRRLGVGPLGLMLLLFLTCLGVGQWGQLLLLDLMCLGSTATAGFDVSKSGGRPTGTTAAARFDMSKSGGRPTGTSAAAGFSVSGVRPTGTTAVKGFKVSSGRPVGTNVASGYGAGVGGGRPCGTEAQRQDGRSDKAQPEVAAVIKDDEEWYTDEKMVNISAAQLKRLENLIAKQWKFDATPFGKVVCWKCGRILELVAHILSCLLRG